MHGRSRSADIGDLFRFLCFGLIRIPQHDGSVAVARYDQLKLVEPPNLKNMHSINVDFTVGFVSGTDPNNEC